MFLPETELMIARDRIQESVREAQFNIHTKESKPSKKANPSVRGLNVSWLRMLITKAAV
jgi:hypothetical protein